MIDKDPQNSIKSVSKNLGINNRGNMGKGSRLLVLLPGVRGIGFGNITNATKNSKNKSPPITKNGNGNPL